MQDRMISQNIIITESSTNLRALGRNALRGKWKVAVIAFCIYTLIMEIPPIVFDSLFGVSTGNVIMQNGNTYGMDAELYSQLYNSMPQYSVLTVLYLLLITGAMELGITLFFLASFRKHNVGPTDIFLGFEKFGKALGLYVYRQIFVLLWTMLFVIPGFIATIRYSQAFFILADNPEKSIKQCMNESKQMMRGNKMKYFTLSLSFIGWAILAAIPTGIITGIVAAVCSNAFIVAIVSVLAYLIITPLYVYVMSTFTGFYEILAGHLIKETQPAPVTIEEKELLEERIRASALEIADEETEEVAEEPAEEPAEPTVVEEEPAETEESEEEK